LIFRFDLKTPSSNDKINISTNISATLTPQISDNDFILMEFVSSTSPFLHVPSTSPPSSLVPSSTSPPSPSSQKSYLTIFFKVNIHFYHHIHLYSLIVIFIITLTYIL
jgi:hypothetical protein